MGDDDTALSERILDVSEAQREAQIQPDSMLDDHRRESIAALGSAFIARRYQLSGGRATAAR
jgi:hypothetical protein